MGTRDSSWVLDYEEAVEEEDDDVGTDAAAKAILLLEVDNILNPIGLRIGMSHNRKSQVDKEHH